MTAIRLMAALLMLTLWPCAAARSADDAAGLAQFEARIRPLLADKCYPCHSASAGKHKGGLTLDSRPSMLTGGDTGPALVAGEVEKSLMIKAVRYGDPDLRMPPKERLSPEKVADLEAWIRAGAPDPRTQAVIAKPVVDAEAARRHWAYQPLRLVPAPAVRAAAWVAEPSDAFVLNKLEAAGLAPAAPAPRATLLRRLSLDLTGLPPTVEELDAFLTDHSTEALARVVDRLLASPAFGERWARHWLDLARFAESHGFEHDYDRPHAWPYRDFVIQALNQDLPYDRFVSWQLAGDELAPEDNLALAATGFIAAGVWPTQLTKNEVEKARYDALDDMLSTTFTAMLGTTIGCARCHDHKYDPILQQDYYRLLATFTTTVRSEVEREVPDPALAARRATFNAEQGPLDAALTHYAAAELPARLLERTPALRAGAGVWTVLLADFASAGGARFTAQADGSLLASGARAEHDEYTATATTTLSGITAIRLEALADDSLPHHGPGRADNGNFALTSFRLESRSAAGGAWQAVDLGAAQADFEQNGLPARSALAGGGPGWAIDPQFGHDHAICFTLTAPQSAPGGCTLRMVMHFDNNTGHAIGRPRLALCTAPGAAPTTPATLTPALLDLLALAPAQRSVEQTNALLSAFAPLDAGWSALDQAARAHRAQEPKPALVKMMIGTEGLPAIRLHIQGDDFFTQTYLLKRGDPNLKLQPVTPSFWPILMGAGAERWQSTPPQGSRTSYRRRALATWLVDTDKGAGALLARVAVNRVWQHLFGRGLVTTTSDFGLHGAPPSHPELLDHLASSLVHGGWRLKPVIRSLVLSSAYGQSSESTAAAEAADPENALLAHFRRHRLEAESIRDAMLAVGGRLDPTLYGPGTLDSASRRRSIYFTVKRSQAIPFLAVFDLPEPLQGVGERPTTVIAPQALALLNDPQVRGWAAGFAARLSGGSGGSGESGTAAAVKQAYRIALARAPSPIELSDALSFIAHQTTARGGAAAAGAGALALTDYCQVLMCLNEFVYVD